MDIRKISKKVPFERLEKPKQRELKISKPIAFWSDLARKISMVSCFFAAFSAPLFILDPITGSFARTGWFFILGLAFITEFLARLLDRDFPIKKFFLNWIIILLFGGVFVSTFFGLDLKSSLSFSHVSREPLLPVLSFGILWIFIFINSKNSVKIFKSIIVGWFLGSSILAFAIIFKWFGSGYQNLAWVAQNSWIGIFTVNVFLLMSFAMLQKGLAKAVWTASIIFHLVVLFLWDAHYSWIILLAGTSAICVFQIVYSKKLWQRNFIYPIQIWFVSILLLLAPIKTFTGISVPEYQRINYRSAVAGFEWKKTESLLGVGAGNALLAIQKTNGSFFDLRRQGIPLESDSVIVPSYIAIFLESGLIGIILWLSLFFCVFVLGFLFLKKNRESLALGTMTEEEYLGAVSFLSFALILGVLAFSSWSFWIFWMFAIVLGGVIIFLSRQAEFISIKLLGAYFWIFCFIFSLVFFVWIIGTFIQARSAFGLRFARQAVLESDALESVKIFEKALMFDPGNTRYKAIKILNETSAIDVSDSLESQKNILENSLSLAQEIKLNSSDYISVWASAMICANLEKIAEGSSALAREHYLKSMELAPYNLPLSVAFARFIRERSDLIVSQSLSEEDLRLEAKSALFRALSFEREYLPARLELALITEQELGPEEAINYLLPFENSSPEIRYHVGRLYFNENLVDYAIERFQMVLLEAPNHSNAMYSLGVAFQKKGMYQEALEKFEKVLEINPDNYDVVLKIEQVSGMLKP